VGESRLVSRNVKAGSGRTSMRLEPELWEALDELCERERLSVRDAIVRIDAAGHQGSRTSAVRVMLVRYFREAATEHGHHRARHGALLAAAMVE
jgi:predicted DNA-binding ribbon-helix-helix protein